MSNAVFELERISDEPLSLLAEKLISGFRNSQGFFSGEELVVNKVESLGDAEAALLIFEKLYFRNGSYSNLTIEITSYMSRQKAIVIGSGGGEGVLNISWGANANFARRAYEKLTELGFEEKCRPAE